MLIQNIPLLFMLVAVFEGPGLGIFRKQSETFGDHFQCLGYFPSVATSCPTVDPP